jgi:hypothetical protein
MNLTINPLTPDLAPDYCSTALLADRPHGKNEW